MSTSNLTEIISTAWSSFTNEQATNLYLYGTLVTPEDLNDRIRPIVAQNRNSYIDGDGDTIYVDALVKFDRAAYMSAGPGRYASPSELEFVDRFFTEENILDKNGNPITGQKTIAELKALGIIASSSPLYSASY